MFSKRKQGIMVKVSKLIRYIFILLVCTFLTSSFDYTSFISHSDTEKEIFWKPPTADILALRERIDNVLNSYESFEYEFGVKIISLAEPQIFYEYQADEPFIPASNLKIITTAAALEMLGVDFFWKTEFYIDGEKNLHIKANGDPTLYKHNHINIFFKSIADSLKANGINRLSGDIIIDDSGFNNNTLGYGWKEENSFYSYSAKPSAVAFFENSLQFKITPTNIGQKALISIYPVHTGYEIINNITTSSNNKQNLWFDRDPDSNKITFNGNIWHRSKPQYRTLAIQKPEVYALDVIKYKLSENGISFDGNIYYNSLPEQEYNIYNYEKLFQIETKKFIDMLGEVNKHSNNFIANQLYLSLGSELDNVNNSFSLIKQWLKRNKINTDYLEMYDGSGLSIYNRCSVNNLSSILFLMYNSPRWLDFYNSLAINGREGTMRNSFKNKILNHNVYAKTGFIIGSRALSGYIETADNELLAFSIIVNKEKSHIRNFNRIIEDILLELATFERDKVDVHSKYGIDPENSITHSQDDIIYIDSLNYEFPHLH